MPRFLLVNPFRLPAGSRFLHRPVEGPKEVQVVNFKDIAPALEGRHPDHRAAAQLARDACFVAGLGKVAPEVPKHRPTKVVHALTYRQDFVKPTFVVDISEVFETKMEAIRCYDSLVAGVTQAGEVYPTGEPLYDVIRHHAAYYGALIRCRYGEPFHTSETVKIDDIVAMDVATF